MAWFKGNFKQDEKKFIKIFKELCYSRQHWQVWQDLMTVMACSIANAVDQVPERFNEREEEYQNCIQRLGGVEKPAELFSIIVQALEDNPDQDYLGTLYMQLNMGNHWKGQFFTPFCVSRAMSELTMGDCQKQIEENGWISVCDPCIGGGAMLLAAVSTLKKQNVFFHDHVLFVGQDIDRVVGMMAYIQISLLGCPGYIVIADSIRYPLSGDPLIPREQREQEFWYTPLYFSEVWHYRRLFNVMGNMFYTEPNEKPKHFDSENPAGSTKEKEVVQIKLKRRGIAGQMSLFDL